MPGFRRGLRTRRAAPWSALGVGAALLLAAGAVVDLSPRVEGDFFFAPDDPQMAASRRVGEDFPSGRQLVLRVEGGDGYAERVAALSDDLATVPGVGSVFSIAREDPGRSPLFARILLTPDPDATNVVLVVDETDPEELLPRVEEVVSRHAGPQLQIVISGVPAIVEMIRRALFRDLVVFSAAAVAVFALLMGLVYRDAAVVAGTLATCLGSVGATLLLVHLLDIGIGLLTANLVTIVFVLTLSHTVFLTGNWRREAARAGEAGWRDDALAAAVRRTWEGSFWSMATTLLGFGSLLVATARPLRELGMAGAVGTLTALASAYLLYPAILGPWARRPDATREASLPSVHAGGRAAVVAAAAAVLVVLGTGVPRVDTDPGLLTYFAEGTELYEGLARIDADGGSSTLDVVVEDPAGAAVSSPEVWPRLEALQEAFEADPAVGVVLSPTVLIEHARTIPLAGLLPVDALLGIASSPALDGVGLGFVTPERDRARFSLRMRETADDERSGVLTRVRDRVEAAGLTPVTVAGLYDLQAQLGRLIASSLRIGIGGLLLLFLAIAFVVARSARTAVAMWGCLAAIPLVILGTFGHLGVAVDIITSPASNIALAVGADSMIHLVVRMRHLRDGGHADPWGDAVRQIGPAVLGATLIVSAGFGIFALSSFPPTRRFGAAVIIGTATAAVMALVVLPRLGWRGAPASDTLSAAAG